jgi:hypothetical protein
MQWYHYSERLKKNHYKLYKLLKEDNLMVNIETPEKVIEYLVLHICQYQKTYYLKGMILEF